MTSKERVAAAIACKPVDKVPLGFYVVDYDTIEHVLGRPTYVRNKIATTIALWEGRRDEVAESLKKDTVEFYRKIDCADIIFSHKEAHSLPPKGYEPERPKKIADDKWQFPDGRVCQASWEVNEIACVYDPRPPKTECDFKVEDFEGPIEEPKPPDPSTEEASEYLLAELGNKRYIAGPCGGTTALAHFGGFENTMMMHALRPELVHAANRRSVKLQNMYDKQRVRPGMSGFYMEQDMAGSNGPHVSPQMFRELCFPYFKERVQHAKKYLPQVILHNCGNNIPYMEMFIEAGLDCYQSLQTTAGMEIGRLKEMFGRRICFWGGVAVENLILGTPEDVRRDVRTALERGAPGSGFILGPSHSIAKNTKYENFMAMLNEFDRLRDKF